MIDFVTVYDEQGRVLWISRTDPALGIPVGSLLGKSIFDYAEHGHADECVSHFGDAMLTRKSKTFVSAAQHNGVVREYRNTVHPVMIPGRATLVTHSTAMPTVHLSPREIEIAKLYASDLSTRQVAAKLNLCISTVDSHRSAICAKLGNCGVAGITIFCLKHGLVSP